MRSFAAVVDRRRIVMVRTATLIALAAVLAASCSRNPEQRKQQLVARGDSYAAEHRYAAAAIEYRNAIQVDVKYGAAHRKLSATYLQLGDAPSALREAMRAADFLPDNFDAQLEAANLLILAGRYADARDRAQR